MTYLLLFWVTVLILDEICSHVNSCKYLHSLKSLNKFPVILGQYKVLKFVDEFITSVLIVLHFRGKVIVCLVRMVGSSVTVMCYWNGQITTNSRGIAYEGAIPKATLVNSRIKYKELVDKIYAITGFDKNQVELKITCRYPGNNGDYIPFLVEDDNSVSVVVAVTRRPGINCLEFYLEAVPACTDAHVGAPSLIRSSRPTQSPGKGIGSSNCNYEAASGFCISEDQGSCEARREDFLATGIANLEEHEGVGREDYDVSHDDAPASECADVQGVNEVTADECEIRREFHSPCHIEELCVGQRFLTKEDLQNAVKAYSLKVNQEYFVAYSTANLWVLKCKQAPECPWRLRAIVPNRASFFEIKKYTAPHTCNKPINNQDHAQLDAAFVARHIKALVKAQTSISSSSIQAEILEKFNYNISMKKAWMAKQKALIELFGDRVKRSARGRPKSARLSNEMDAGAGSSSTRCILCKQFGHNKRRCPSEKH